MGMRQQHELKRELSERSLAFLQEYRWGLLIALFSLVWGLYVTSSLVHIPGPIFGGDLYRERGFVEHLLRGGSVFADPAIDGAATYFPFLGYTLAALVAYLTGLSSQKTLILLPVFLMSVRVFAYYLLGKRVFKDHFIAAAFALLFFSRFSLELKTSHNIAHLGMVFCLLLLYTYFESPSWRTAFYAGVAYGVIALSHGAAFIGFTLFVLFLLVLYLGKSILFDKRRAKIVLFEHRHLVAFYGIAVLISLLFFGPLIVKYHLHQDNPVGMYAMHDASTIGIFFPFKGLWAYFNPTFDVLYVVRMLFLYSGVAFCVLNLRRTPQAITLLMLLAAFLSVGHYLITMPLLGMWFEPWKVSEQYFLPVMLLTAFGIKHIMVYAPSGKEKHVMFVLLVLVLFQSSVQLSDALKARNDQWFRYGSQMDAQTETMYEMGAWIEQNTAADAVFLANDESAFALNAMSGSKVAFLRRVHANYFVDVDGRYADGMVMLYGNDSSVRHQLLKKHGVDYVYIDQYLLTNPMIVKQEYADLLERNGVHFEHQKVRFDPSSPDAPQFDALVVNPQNLTIAEDMTALKAFTIGGQPYSAIFAVTVQ